jgi:hypothetical protein
MQSIQLHYRSISPSISSPKLLKAHASIVHLEPNLGRTIRPISVLQAKASSSFGLLDTFWNNRCDFEYSFQQILDNLVLSGLASLLDLLYLGLGILTCILLGLLIATCVL